MTSFQFGALRLDGKQVDRNGIGGEGIESEDVERGLLALDVTSRVSDTTTTAFGAQSRSAAKCVTGKIHHNGVRFRRPAPRPRGARSTRGIRYRSPRAQ